MRVGLQNVLHIILVLLPICSYFVYFLPSAYSRLFLLFIFFLPFAIAYYFSKEQNGREISILICIIVVATIVFCVRNLVWFNSFVDESQISGTRLLAQSYAENGRLIFSDPHSYFPQTSLLLYVFSIICGFSLYDSSIMLISLHILLTGFVGLYGFKVMSRNQNRRGLTFFIVLVVLSLLASNNLMYTNIAYRYLASSLFLLLLFFLYDKNYGDPQRKYYIIVLLLTVGVVLGDPTSAMLMVPLFILVSIMGRRLDIVYAVISIGYLLYSATSYLLSIRTYTRFALSGFLEFLQDLIKFEFPERVIPWHRTLSLSPEDAYFTSIGYGTLLLVSGIVGLFYVVSWIRNNIREDNLERSVLAKVAGLGLLGVTVLGALTYVGASVRPEVPFSDIRTIALIFASSLLLFSFVPKLLTKGLTDKRGLILVISFLLMLSSLRIVYNTYPKSLYDTINVVEDGRLGSTSIYIVADFIKEYYDSGGVVADYKTLNRIGETLPYPQYEKRLLKETTLDYPFAFYPDKSILIFSTAGIKYPSVYHSEGDYQAANNFSLVHNRIYDNGIIVLSSNERG